MPDYLIAQITPQSTYSQIHTFEVFLLKVCTRIAQGYNFTLLHTL